MIKTLVNKNINFLEENFLDLGIKYETFLEVNTDSVKSKLFYESLKRNNINNACYLYLVICDNFYSKYSFLNFESNESLEGLLQEYFSFTLKMSSKLPSKISSLDKLLLQIASPTFNSNMEIDHIYPQQGKKFFIKEKPININHLGNLCYLSKLNNQMKSNKLPIAHINRLEDQKKWDLLDEFKSQIYWQDLKYHSKFNELNDEDNYLNFLQARVKIITSKIMEKL